MKLKRLLSVLLVFVTVAAVAVLSGCSNEKTEEGVETSKEIVTLNMYIITDDETDPEAANKVQMMINRELLPIEKTLLKINYIKESEYWDVVESVMEKTEGKTTQASVKGLEGKSFNQMVDYIFDDKTKNIQLTEDQIDIFVVNDYEKYVELAKDGKLSAFTLGTLDQKIYPTFVSAATVDGTLYGIPTNTALEEGEFTYLVINKTLLDKYGFKPKEMLKVESGEFEKFLAAVKAGETDVIPMSGPVEYQGLEIYDDSVMSVGNLSAIGSIVQPMYDARTYRDFCKQISKYEKEGYFAPEGTDFENAKFAVKVDKTTELLGMDFGEMTENLPDEKRLKQWTAEDGTEYIRILYDIPRVSADKLFTSAMCVSSSSVNTERAMEIVTLFQSNAELANLLQYGIEGENYTYEAGKGIVDSGRGYSMNNVYTGNTFIKYNEDPDYIDKSILRNHTQAPSSFLGFKAEFSDKLKAGEYETLKALVKKANERIEQGEDFDTVWGQLEYELGVMGYSYSAASGHTGVYQDLNNAYLTQSRVITSNFYLSPEIKDYNKVFSEAEDEEVVEPEEDLSDDTLTEEAENENGEDAADSDEDSSDVDEASAAADAVDGAQQTVAA